MVRRAFFSFHFGRDSWRSNVIRNSWVTGPSEDSRGYIDGSDWEDLKKQGDPAIRRWINDQLKGTSVTVVIIGRNTHNRKWVNYEIEKSIEDGKGLLGIHAHTIADKDGNTDTRGQNPLDNHQVKNSVGISQPASSVYNTHTWNSTTGPRNIGDWIEQAASIAGR